jgi:outer membrane protein OmpA-like peptidoglycan-associated protein
MNIKDLFVVSYAYEFPGANIGSYSKGSHEIMLGIKFCKEKEDAESSEYKPMFENQDVVTSDNTEENNDTEIEGEKVVELAENKTDEEVVKEELVKTEKEVEVVEVADVSTEVTEDIPVPIPEEVQEHAPETNSELNLSPNEIAVTVKFDFNSSNLPISYNQTLNELANEMAKDESMKLIINGYSCNMGTEEVRYAISRIRGQKVKDYLIKQGVNNDRMVVKSRGDSNPLVPNTSLENRKKNRRVEVVIVH